MTALALARKWQPAHMMNPKRVFASRLHNSVLSYRMLIIIGLAVCHLAFVLGCSFALAQGDKAQDIELSQMVKGLGLKDQEIAQQLDVLAATPHAAVAILVAQLRPIARKAYYPNKIPAEARHVISCLRALHYLTGITFSAKTKCSLTDDEKQFLDFDTQMHVANPEHKLHFFGVWMSRDADYVAPIDVQKSIIKQWQQWQAAQGNTFEHKPPKRAAESSDDWYWYG